MVKQSYGSTTWDEETGGKRGGAGAGGGKRDQFMRLENGPNVLRVVTKPHRYLSHKYKVEGDQGYGEKIPCSMPLHGSCPVCDLKDKPKKRWFVGVIDRKHSQYKILDISVLVYDALKALNRDEDYGDPMNYDIDIKFNKDSTTPSGFYNVVPKPPKPLTESDIALKATASEEELDKKCTPPTPEWVLAKLNKIRESKGLAAVSAGSVPSASSNGTSAVPVDMSNDDEDIVFPAAGQA